MKKFKFLGYEFSPVGYLPEDYTGINNYLVEIPVQLPVQYNRMAFRAMCNDIDPLPSVFRCESGDYAGKIIVPGKQSLYIYSGPYKPLEVNTDDKETPDASSATSETPAEPVDSSTETPPILPLGQQTPRRQRRQNPSRQMRKQGQPPPQSEPPSLPRRRRLKSPPKSPKPRRNRRRLKSPPKNQKPRRGQRNRPKRRRSGLPPCLPKPLLKKRQNESRRTLTV